MAAALLCMVACSKKNDGDATIVCPPPFTYSQGIVLTEIGKKIGTNEWNAVTNGKQLRIAYNYTDAARKDLSGAYLYNSSNLGLQIDTIGAVAIKDNALVFLNFKTNKWDSILVNYNSNTANDTIILRNTSIQPEIEVKYKKSNVNVDAVLSK
jgi:hypothetical protein